MYDTEDGGADVYSSGGKRGREGAAGGLHLAGAGSPRGRGVGVAAGEGTTMRAVSPFSATQARTPPSHAAANGHAMVNGRGATTASAAEVAALQAKLTSLMADVQTEREIREAEVSLLQQQVEMDRSAGTLQKQAEQRRQAEHMMRRNYDSEEQENRRGLIVPRSLTAQPSGVHNQQNLLPLPPGRRTMVDLQASRQQEEKNNHLRAFSSPIGDGGEPSSTPSLAFTTPPTGPHKQKTKKSFFPTSLGMHFLGTNDTSTTPPPPSFGKLTGRKW